VILAPISARFGVGGLLLAGAMAGVILVILGLARLGRVIQFVPNPVVTGFTTGIAVVIATVQVKDLLGLATGPMPDQYLDKVATLAWAIPTWHGAGFAAFACA
jgi:SulP family sulfate permease